MLHLLLELDAPVRLFPFAPAPALSGIPHRDQGSPYRSGADVAKRFPPLSFQRVATIKFSNDSVLITIRIAGDGGSPLHSSVYSSKFRMLQVFCFHTLHKTAGVGVGVL